MSLKPKILADENIPNSTIQALRSLGYDVLSVWEVKPGLSDDQVVQLSIKEQRIIVTFDKDFGRLALTNPNIPGVLLLRIPPKDANYITRRILSALTTVDNVYGKLIIVRKETLKIISLR